MDFGTYKHQLKLSLEPVRQPTASVILRPDDCESIVETGLGKEVTIQMALGWFITYTTCKPAHLPQVKNDLEPTLYTMDEDGNPKVASVFKLILYTSKTY